MARRNTLREIAADLGLSVTTVSRALGGHSDVAAGTRERIRDAAERLGYVPNNAGKALVTGRSGFVALLLPLHDHQPLDPFLGEFVGGLGEGLVERGRDLYLATVPRGRSELEVLRHVVESGRADGVVLTRTAEDDERVDFLAERGFPFITHGRVLDATRRYSWVDTDGAAAFAEAFELLHGLGHRAFGLLSITDPMTFRLTRESGLEAAIAARGDPGVTLDVRHVERFDARAVARSVEAMLRGDRRPSALLALTDDLALTALEVAASIGLGVPDELSIVGFDDLPAAAWAPPGLTTFDQRTRETALELAHTLVDIIDGRTAEQHRLLRPRLVARASHGRAPARPGQDGPTTSDPAVDTASTRETLADTTPRGGATRRTPTPTRRPRRKPT